MSESDEAHGTVKWFDAYKGYGFVVFDDGGPDALLHVKALQEYGLKTIHDGAEVSCLIAERERGWVVTSIVSIAGIKPRRKLHLNRSQWSARERAAWLLGAGMALEDIHDRTGLPRVDLLSLAAAAAHEEAAGSVAAPEWLQRATRARDNGTAA